jgi:hypothetical protein
MACGTSQVSKKGTAMAKKRKVVRRAWSKEDVRTLKSMAKDRKGAPKISKALKRTIEAEAICSRPDGVGATWLQRRHQHTNAKPQALHHQG